MSNSEFFKNKRYIEVFNELVDTYVETGEPVGSRTLSKRLLTPLSPATIRNVMADLEDLGILCSEHTSSGRKPTDKGWRVFVNGLIEMSDLKTLDENMIKSIQNKMSGHNIETVLENASNMLSELTKCASVILTPTVNDPIRHIDFVLLSPGRVLVVIVTDNGMVENRLIDVPVDISTSVLERATRYLNTKLMGMTLDQIRDIVRDEVSIEKEGLDIAANKIVEMGLGVWTNDGQTDRLIIKGQSHLLNNASEFENLQNLFQKLDEKQTLKTILDQSISGQGIQVFIGSENKMFNMTGCSMIVSPYQNSKKQIIGAIGVIGPNRMKYAKLINLVDYTAKILSEII